MKILVVEDTEDSRVVLEDFLTSSGYEVAAASNGLDAMEFLQNNKVDLIITDILMPLLDGYELCRQVRRSLTLREIPLIIYTATYTDERDITFGLSLGADRFLVKPFDLNDLLMTIDEVIRESHTTKPQLDVEAVALQHAQVLGRKLDKKVEELNKQRQISAELSVKLENIANAVPVLIGEIDREYRYRYVNNEYERWYGIRHEDIIGMNVSEIIGHDEFDRIEPHLIDAFSGKRVLFETEAISAKNGWRYVQVQLIPEHIGSESSSCIYSVITDITEKHNAEIESEKIRRRVEQSQKLELIGQLTSGVAHDFNNLLTTILGFSSLGVARIAELDREQLRYYFENIETAGIRGKELVTQLLTFCRGKKTTVAPVLIKEEFDAIMRLLQPTMLKSVDFGIELGDESIQLTVNRGQLSQAVINLCINARDAINGKGKVTLGANKKHLKLAICDSCYQEFAGDFVEISVRDNGPGIPDSIKTKIFTPFFTTKEEGKGSGMGLAMVHGIVHERNGHILIETPSTGGTCIRLLFPLDKNILEDDHVFEQGETTINSKSTFYPMQ